MLLLLMMVIMMMSIVFLHSQKIPSNTVPYIIDVLSQKLEIASSIKEIGINSAWNDCFSPTRLSTQFLFPKLLHSPQSQSNRCPPFLGPSFFSPFAFNEFLSLRSIFKIATVQFSIFYFLCRSFLFSYSYCNRYCEFVFDHRPLIWEQCFLHQRKACGCCGVLSFNYAYCYLW